MKIYARFFGLYIYKLVDINNDDFIWEFRGYYACFIGINYYEMYNQVDYFSSKPVGNIEPPPYMPFAKEQLRDKDLVET